MNHGGHGGMGGGDGGACKISMLWNWYTVDACFLAESWHVKSRGAFAASCIGVIALVISLEVLRRLGKEYDIYILKQFQSHLSAQSKALQVLAADSAGGVEHQNFAGGMATTAVFRASPLQQLVRAFLHAVTFGVAYIVMLLAMYFNGYIIVSIVIGAGIGKLLCDWMVVEVPIPGVVVGGNEARVVAAAVGGHGDSTMCCG